MIASVESAPNVNAQFSASPTTGMVPLVVVFTNNSTGNITDWIWQYKLTPATSWTSFTLDGSGAFTFTHPGTYDIQLTVSDGNRSKTRTRTRYILVNPQVAAGPEYSYSFVHLSDTQGLQNFPEIYNLTFTEIESLKSQYNISAIFITGDITDEGSQDYSRYESAITLTTIPIYEISGNHDVFDTPGNYTQWDRYVKDGSQKHDYGFVFNDLVVYGFGWHGMGPLDPVAKTAMENLIAVHPTKVPLILTHGYFTTYSGEVTGQRDIIAYDILDSLTRNSLILSGHTHTPTQLGYLRQTDYNNITVVEDFINAQDWLTYSVGRLFTITSDGSQITNMTVRDLYLSPYFVINNTIQYPTFSQTPLRPVTDFSAIFRPSSGYCYFDYNLDGIVNKFFRCAEYSDKIIKGDWQGTGTDGIAIFRPATGFWYFDYNLDGMVDNSFRFGGSSDTIIKGDWQGTGTDGIAIFRPASGFWYFDYNLDGIVDNSFRFGGSSDKVIKGDWQGTGTDGIAIFRPASGFWYFDYNLDGIVDDSFRYGGSDDRIIAEDWQGTGTDGIAIFRPASGFWYFDYNLDGTVDDSFRYGGSDDRIIIGYDDSKLSSLPVISDIIPHEGTSGNIIYISNLSGNGFLSDATVTLMKRGNPNITATDVNVRSATWITCLLPLSSNIVSGSWDVVVTNPNGQYAIYPNLFEIKGLPWLSP